MPPQNKFTGNKFEDYHYQYLEKLIKWYATDKVVHRNNKIKVEWLSGLMKEQFYDEHQRKFLNKMVNSYNNRKK